MDDELLEAFNQLNLNEERQMDDHSAEFAMLGASIMDQKDISKTNSPYFRTRFISNFGCSPRVCGRIWQYLLLHQSPLPRGFSKNHILWGFRFMKEYPTKLQSSTGCKGANEKTAAKWIWGALDEVATLVSVLVSLLKFL